MGVIMRKLSMNISSLLNGISGDSEYAKKAYRASQVRAMWAACVDKPFLDHTNSVYILNEAGNKTLIVYVDESIFAAELNARRELIKLKLLQEFGEDIQEFKILISRNTYKKNYPFKKEQDILSLNNIEPIPLSKKEKEKVNEIVCVVEDEKLRENLKKAIISDWELKKGQQKNNKL